MDDIAMDVMGSTNMGLCENTSDIDFVVYVRCDPDFTGDINSCSQFKEAEKIIETILKPKYAFQIMDSIDLNLVEKSIRAKDYESEIDYAFCRLSCHLPPDQLSIHRARSRIY
jgi:hypothetical protein